MKLSFKLLELSSGAMGRDTASAAAYRHGLPPYEPSQHTERLTALKASLSKLNVPCVSLAEATTLSAVERENLIVFVAGSPTADALYATVHGLIDAGVQPILVVDTLDNYPAIMGTLQRLAEERFQFVIAAQVVDLVQTPMLFLYKYGKSDSTMTLMVVVDAGRKDARMLTIERDRAPFKDEESFTGGFLDAHLESLPQCVGREAREETNTDVPEGDVILVDVRSSPTRDQRGHCVDHGYMWLVPEHQKATILASVKAGDDAKPGSARFVPVTDLLKRGRMAFDHYDLLLAGLATGRILPAANPVLRLINFCIRCLSGLATRLAMSDAVLGKAYRAKANR